MGKNKKNEDEEAVEELRQSWELAAVCHFCRTFKQECKLKPFSVDLLEQALVHPETARQFIGELHHRLMDYAGKHDYDGWEERLQKYVNKNWFRTWEENPLGELDATYRKLDPVDR